MNVTIFKNIIEENIPSMEIYANELLKCMPKNVKGFTISSIRLPIVKYYFHKEIIYPLAAKRHQGDVNHISDHSYAGLLKYLDTKKSVVTCHDLIPLDRPKENSVLGNKRYWRNIKYLPKAARIITNSEYAKKSILRHFDFEERHIKVIYAGVSEEFRVMAEKEKLKKKYDIGKNTLLHIGSSFPRKNVEFILKILEKTRDLFLVKVGSFTKKQIRFLKDRGLSNRVRTFQAIDTDSLVELYNAVDALIIPSLAEGFGLPILEAMACGCPVICSNIEIFHELFEDVAVFTDPNNFSEAIDRINTIFHDSIFRGNLIRSGIEKSKKFGWQKCAEETYNVYEDIFSEIKKLK